MITFLVQSQLHLAVQARAAAYAVEPIYVHPEQTGDRELILIRYAKQPVRDRFIYREIRDAQGGQPFAMWTDSITDAPHRMGDITATNMPEQIAALQVVRLVLRAPFDIGQLARSTGKDALPLAVAPLERAPDHNEFFLKFDIMPQQVAAIPLAVVGCKFVVDPSIKYTTPEARYPQLPSASYTVNTIDGWVTCILS